LNSTKKDNTKTKLKPQTQNSIAINKILKATDTPTPRNEGISDITLKCKSIRKELNAMLSALCKQNTGLSLAQPKTCQQELSKFSATTQKAFIKEHTTSSCENQKVYKGVMCIDCISMKNSDEVIDEVRKSLRKEKVKCVKNGKYLIYCQKLSVKFEIEIMSLEQIKGGNYIRAKKLIGESKDYKKVMKKILANLKLY